MSLILHKVLNDGSFTHEEFDRESWEAALKDPDVAVPMGHPEDGCPGIEALKWCAFFSMQRKRGRALNVAQSELADDGDAMGSTIRSIEPVKEPEKAAPPAGPNWPPTNELTPLLLSEMTGRCIADCDNILKPLRKHTDLSNPPPMVNDKGQWSLF